MAATPKPSRPPRKAGRLGNSTPALAWWAFFVVLVAASAAMPQKSAKVRVRRSLWQILKRVGWRIGQDNLSLVAAGVAFYAMFGLFPALAVLVSFYGLIGDTQVVQSQVADLTALLPAESAKLLNDALTGFLQRSTSHLSSALLVSMVLALWGARAGTAALMTGLNVAFEKEEERSFLTQQAVAIGLTAAGVIFAIVTLTAVAILPLITNLLPITDAARAMMAEFRWPLLTLFIFVALAVTYRFAPSRRHPHWRILSIGSIVAALLWIVGSAAFSFYITRFGQYDATYGSVGAVVVLLLWFWLSAFIVLSGATLDAVIAEDPSRTLALTKRGDNA